MFTDGGGDTEIPDIANCPSDQTISIAFPQSTTTTSWVEPTATDNVTPVDQITRSASHSPGQTFSVGSTTVTYTFSDLAGNQATCSFDVNVIQCKLFLLF